VTGTSFAVPVVPDVVKIRAIESDAVSTDGKGGEPCPDDCRPGNCLRNRLRHQRKCCETNVHVTTSLKVTATKD
jgi:hypothetical protein